MSLKCLKTPGCLDEVLSSKCLKRFRLSFRDPLTSGIVLNLAHGLLKQAEVGYLEELDLSGNHLCESFTSELEAEIIQLFSAIFSLPQVGNLTLVTKDKFLNKSYVAMLERSWREEAGG